VAKPRAERWTRVPEAWEPNDAHRELARCKSVAFDDELANFRDWEFKTPRTDPDATFRTWIRRAAKQVNGAAAPRAKNDGSWLFERAKRITQEEIENDDQSRS
jgi:hypothetical protein